MLWLYGPEKFPGLSRNGPQVGSFINNIRRQVDRAQQFPPVIVEDLGADESLSGINPDMLDYVRRLRPREYFCGDEDVGGTSRKNLRSGKSLRGVRIGTGI